jgi:uncharacterized membrane protein YfhO
MMLAILVIISAWILSFSKNKKRIYVCMLALLLASVGTMYATTNNMGIDGFELDEGMSLRQGSTSERDARSFFIYVNSRTHQGGGLAGGK